MVRRSLTALSISKVTDPPSPPLSMAATAGPRTLSTLGPPEVSDRRSMTRAGSSPSGRQSGRPPPRRAERLPIDHQRHVDGELHDRARPDRAAMLQPSAEQVENRLGARRIGGL